MKKYHGLHSSVFFLSFHFLGKSKTEGNYERHMDDMDLPLLDLSTIITATDNFSEKNKIGEGGFGPVYLVIQYWSMIIVRIAR